MKMKAHLTFSSNSTDQLLPEHGGHKTLHYDCSSSESSCTSLNEQHGDTSRQEGFEYPVDLLGTSWGSYLYSEPPTRSGLKGVIKQLDAVKTKPDQSVPITVPMVRKSPIKRNRKKTTNLMLAAHPKAFMGAMKDLSQINEEASSSDEVVRDKLSRTLDCQSNSPTTRMQANPLLGKIRDLVEMINIANETISKCGVNTNKLNTHKLCSNLEQIVSGELMGEDIPLVYCEVTDCLVEIFRALIEQSKTIQGEAYFMQRTGKQLNRAQEQFFKEQNQLQRAFEEARTQLNIEKQMLQVEKSAVKKSEEELKRIYYDSGQKDAQAVCQPKPPSKRTLTQKSVHEVMQDRNHLMAFTQTKSEQNRLEKLLVTQQREIQQIQKELQYIKTELLLTQDHALKLEHRVAMYKTKASTLTCQTFDDNSMKSHRKPANMTGKTGSLRLPSIHGIMTAQKTLDHEIRRVRRQHEKQQVKEKQITKQLETGYKKLKKTKHVLKEQAAKMKGIYIHDETSSHSLARQKLPHQQPQPPHSKSITHLPKLVQDARGQGAANKNLPTFAFSKTELVTLAHFSDEETADSVIEWLGLQGDLTH